MQKAKRTLGKRTFLIFLTLTLLLTSIELFDFLTPLKTFAAEELNTKDFVVSIGGDESELMFTWYTDQPAGSVSIWKKEEPAGARGFAASNTLKSSSFYIHKATVTGLEPSTEYAYKLIGENGDEAGPYSIKTGGVNNFSFVAVGDSQLATSYVQGWMDTVKAAYGNFDVSFLISVGDQVDNLGGSIQEEFTAFFSPPELKNLPTAVTAGNHEYYTANGQSLHFEHFSFPNMTRFGSGASDFDYWFRYGNALFMVLTGGGDGSAINLISLHKSFLESTVAANQDAKWRFILVHQSLYSEGPHSVHNTIGRNTWPSVIDSLDIDVVFSGHDHQYTRTHQMLGNVPQLDQQWLDSARQTVLDPTGTVYFTLNSSSGSKNYRISPQASWWSAKRHSGGYDFSIIDITDTTFSIKVYRAADMAVMDEYKILKSKK